MLCLILQESPKYLPNFKNPCWYAIENGKLHLKCVPYYHILGVAKSGTTDLSYRILAHEDVLGCNDCYKQKEIFYWSRLRYEDTVAIFGTKLLERILQLEHVPVSLARYSPSNVLKGIWTRGRHGRLYTQHEGSGESMQLQLPSTKVHYRGTKDRTESYRIRIPQHDYRLYSDYTMLGGSSAEDFHEAVSDTIQIEEACMKNHTVEQCLFSLDISRRLRTRIYFGCYSVYMRQWLKVFPRDQFLILRTEDHNKGPKAQLRKVYNYLKLNYTEEWLASITRVPHQNASKKKKGMGPMLQKTRILLDGFYSRYNQDLADMLQDKMFLWLT
ncbi:carbohydrate sulfotransferase 15-like [Haliotis rubra]|uniref:carbohydrate sulfotransferase 15-like n=1 Tax=Haliotis rubra TaxID=36100 RepID=UPI001EE5D572|nr:carbohydrate sulfotransferase 15-like [Haliotis rubra]